MSDACAATPSPAMTATPAKPRITTATSTSISDSPRSFCKRRSRIGSDLYLVEDAIHGRHQRDRDEADEGAHDDDDRWLEQGGQLLDLVIKFGLVVLRGYLELRVKRAGVFANSKHLHGGVREKLGSHQRKGQPLPFEHGFSRCR